MAGRASGKWVAVALLAGAVAAAIGTCARFASDNPTSREVEILNAYEATAVFRGPQASRLRPGLPAKLSAQGWPRAVLGEVRAVEALPGGVRLRAVWSEPIAPDPAADWILSVEIVP